MTQDKQLIYAIGIELALMVKWIIFRYLIFILDEAILPKLLLW